MDYEKYMGRLEERYNSVYVQIPNKLIGKLTEAMDKHGMKTYVHYAYSYLVLHAFLYKYAHYVDEENNEYLNVANIKELLKYNPRNQRVDAVSKKGGILEEEGFIETTTDIPLSVSWEGNKKGFDKRKIVYLSEYDDTAKILLFTNTIRTPNFHVAIPEFMLDYENSKGSMNDYRDTYRMTYGEFHRFMFHDDLTTRDFLIYGFLKSSIRDRGYAQVSYESIQRKTGLSNTTVKNTSDKLEKAGIIKTYVEVDTGNVLYKRTKKYFINKAFLNRSETKFRNNQKKRKKKV